MLVLMVAVAAVGGFLVVQGFRGAELPGSDILGGGPSGPAGAPMPTETFALAPGAVTDPSDEPVAVAAESVVIPSLGIDASLRPNEIDASGLLVIPEDVAQVTYWTESAPIASPTGAVLVAGHVDSRDRGAGALFELHRVSPGAAIHLNHGGVTTRWKVVGMETIVKEALPQDIFRGDQGARELYLVTCGGEVVQDAAGRNTYSDNVIVTAVPY
ncbi:class F sortase [Rhodococcus rhodnii]|uniref:Class F sortase n=1 Tax=Rhodococcus rhodnii TaxID=38312 RepID=A0A6P2CI11_9NOCA|nr:class F sortase [Rhodococcus rhodnii]